MVLFLALIILVSFLHLSASLYGQTRARPAIRRWWAIVWGHRPVVTLRVNMLQLRRPSCFMTLSLLHDLPTCRNSNEISKMSAQIVRDLACLICQYDLEPTAVVGECARRDPVTKCWVVPTVWVAWLFASASLL